MDYHYSFRMQCLKDASALLGQRRPTRLPVSNSPSARQPQCKHSSPSRRLPLQSKPSEPAVPVRMRRVPPGKAPAEVRAQVKQLQFWLKVFSRFCQGRAEQE